MTHDVRGEDYEAAKPVPARTLVTGDPWVREHLPECAERRAEWRWSEDCICDELRACEARVRKEVATPTWSYGVGREAGIELARDAMPHDEGCLSNDADADARDCNCWRPLALAAIDALRADHA